MRETANTFSTTSTKGVNFNAESIKISLLRDSVLVRDPEGVACQKCPKEGDAKYLKEIELARKKFSMFDGFAYNVSTIQVIWERFEDRFGPTGSAKDTYHVWQALLKDTLDLLVRDNIQYAELSTGFGDLMEKDGTVVPYEVALQYLQDQVDLYRKKHADFHGVNLILTTGRVGLTDTKFLRKLNETSKYYRKWKLVRGFDLVGSRRTLLSFAEQFIKWTKETGSHMPFAFHAGETLWTGFEADENVVDAQVLLTKRIGKDKSCFAKFRNGRILLTAHGYALDAHPLVLELVRAHNISIEFNPISNQGCAAFPMKT